MDSDTVICYIILVLRVLTVNVAKPAILRGVMRFVRYLHTLNSNH